MNKTKIEWCDYTWNPMIGCKHNCSYCYAKELNNRFKFIPDWNDPQFFAERLLEPYTLRKPSTIFVGSMCDLFGDWVDYRWVEQIIRVCKDNPQHKFMFLTKSPGNYRKFTFPANCWLGATMTNPNFYNLNAMTWLGDSKVFLSIEPIMADFTGFCNHSDFRRMDLVIVGAMTGRKAIETPKAWIESVKHHNIFYKGSAKKILGI